MGCGRVGAASASALEAHGHSVAVVDQNPTSFRRLADGFSGRRITGLGFDKDILSEAGIGEAFGFAAVSSGDNSNILAARVVRETFGVENVVARIYDHNRAEVYERLGIATVAAVPWAADQVLRSVLPSGAITEYQDPTGQISISVIDVHPDWVGSNLTELERVAGGRVAFISRLGRAETPGPDMVFQSGDRLYLATATDQVAEAERTLARPPEAEE